jgi:ergothioneine biosynthesis protein EgtB
VTPTPERYCDVRSLTETLASPLSGEDQTVQSMPDVSPTKWHRAHTSWFFETFLLTPSKPGYKVFHPRYGYLFNSYYEAVGARYPRPDRGLVSRPGIEEIASYRRHVDGAMLDLLEGGAGCELAELGLHHEQQHQELLLMDIKHVLSVNPLEPAYLKGSSIGQPDQSKIEWTDHPGGMVEIGHEGDGFAFDNEGPRHERFLEPFQLSQQVVTNADWLAFIDDGGYGRPELWLSDGWGWVNANRIDSPLYWRQEDDVWREFTLHGPTPLDPSNPVCHISYYEADAFAHWTGYRLPTEFEWEAVYPTSSAGLDLDRLHPQRVEGGDVWEWTASAYTPYPRFRAPAGAVGEYNGKFMVNQQVLRGGCCLTPPGHTRSTYRNFFPPSARWPMTGLRLARDV